MRKAFPAAWAALAAAALFGASTPLVKLLIGEVPVLLLAGLLYLGSGVGLVLLRALRDRGWQASGLSAGDWPWLLGAILFGGVLGPVLLVFGLTRLGAGPASLLLNLEAVFTAVIAWVVFRENAGRRIVLGMALIVAGGAVLAWPAGAEVVNWAGLAAVAAACLCWAVDNNLTRRVSGADALFIAGIKGLIAGMVNSALALMLGTAWPAWSSAAAAMAVGLLGYGASLVLFVLSTAPFIGAAITIVFLGETTSAAFWLAAGLMALGVWLHLTEHHAHLHTHEAQEHSHRHLHDEHHQHAHDFDWNGAEPHSHWHRHDVLTHKHPHFPDIHHRHGH